MMTMHRRPFLRSAALLLGTCVLPDHTLAQADPSHPVPTANPLPSARLAAAWRVQSGTGNTPTTGDFVGILQLDWAAGLVRMITEVPVAGRAHGLLAETDGGFLAVSSRPGRWLLRCDAQGQVTHRLAMDDDTPNRTLDGHVTPSANGQWLFTTETDRSTGEGWVSVRDHRNLVRVAQWRTHGIDPHQCLTDTDGTLLVANGGIPRTSDGQKRDLHRMAPSLVRIAPDNGELLGQWRLDDPRLSIRHMAWSRRADATPLLGIGLQAEHDTLEQRRDAPVLAVWNGKTLRIPTRSALGGGYAGDIAPGPGGGFVLSGQRVNRGVLWHPDAPNELMTIAELHEVCALSTWPLESQPGGVLLGAARGVARWHPRHDPAMLAWPRAMSPDNHWVVLS